jgi:uncharacterized protein DUF4229
MTDQPVDPDAGVSVDLPVPLPVPVPADPTADLVTPAAPVPATKSHAFLRYTTARIALFVLAVFVVWLTRLASGVLLVIIALFISGLASFALLGRQRAEVSASLFGRQERRRARRLAGRVDDDDDDEAYEQGGALYTPEFYNRENR